MKRIVNIFVVLALILALTLSFTACSFVALEDEDIKGEDTKPDDTNGDKNDPEPEPGEGSSPDSPISLDNIPAFNGNDPYVVINGGKTYFTDADMTATSYETYSPLDSLGRCGMVIACIGIDIMPTEDRGSIGSVKPSGWHTVKYDIVDGKYLYNRCHLIGYQLTGENANRENLITGTRYMNVDGMLPFENMVADYVKETENHVLYRVTPIFDGTNLVANGVLIEAKSVEDNGEELEFCVYVYNNQPGIIIDYRNGESKLDDGNGFPTETPEAPEAPENPNTPGAPTVYNTYVINKSTKKVHDPDCTYAINMKEENKEIYEGILDDLLSDGDFSACGSCKPE